MSQYDKQQAQTLTTQKQGNISSISKANSKSNVTPNDMASATISPIVKNKSAHFPSEKGKNGNNNNSPEDKKNRSSPFHVVHNFYLDELEKEKAEREKLQKQTRERLEKEKKKRLDLLEKLKDSGKLADDKFKNKDWISLGGLGANIGTQDWNHKTKLHNKMWDFSKEIKKMNFEKIKCVPFMSVSHLHSNPPCDPRTVGIQYSKGVPRPRVMIGQRMMEGLVRSQSKDEMSQLQRLDMNHLKYMEMMKQM